MPPGELAIVLHTHMPYVEGFGTWPFGEEWLWEAIATSYVPLLDEVLGRAPITLSLTPVLCDQLEAPGAVERCIRFLREVRPESHRLDIAEFRSRGEHGVVAALERSAADYADVAERLGELTGDGLLRALGAHATWTSSATHAVLPLLCLGEAVELQLRTGIDSHRRRFGSWGGGLWLPECGYAPWLNPLLEEVGVRAACVELTGRFGAGDPRHLRPLRTDEGVVLWPLDRATMDLVWAGDGYPAHGGYRAHRNLTPRHHRAWSTDGSPYDPERAADLVREDARDFVARVRARLAAGGVCVCALDTELLGHWWHEGVHWLRAVIDEAARQGLAVTHLDDALARHPALPAPTDLQETSWGEGGDLRTWSSPKVADLAWQARTAELRMFARRHAGRELPARAIRELLALQASDWAFLAYREWSGDYPRERAGAHHRHLERALTARDPMEPRVRNLAPYLA